MPSHLGEEGKEEAKATAIRNGVLTEEAKIKAMMQLMSWLKLELTCIKATNTMQKKQETGKQSRSSRRR